MAADFPTNVVNLPNKSDGDKLYGAEYNKIVDEITAIETGLVTSKLATLTSAPAANKVLTTDGSGNPTWAAKAPDADKLDGNDSAYFMPASYADGWIPVSATWTYASATTITVPSGAASIYNVGMGIRLTQTSVKYFVIVKVEDTKLTFAPNSDYSVADAAISAISYAPNPATALGFPVSFNYTPTFTGFSTNPTYWVCKFSVSGRVCIYTLMANASGVSNSSVHEVSAPIAAAFESWTNIGIAADNGGIVASPMGYLIGDQVRLYTDHGLSGWTASGDKKVSFTVTYRF